MQVRSKNATIYWIVVHVEIQGGQVTPDNLKVFGARMYQYNYRIQDHYGRVIKPSGQADQPVGLISLGVLTAGKSTATELVHQHNVLDLCRTKFHFPVVYLANWLDRWSELEQLAATNPFAVLVMAQLQVQQAGTNERKKLVSKTQIMRWLYRYQYSETDRKLLFRLVDWMMATPPELEAEFAQTMVTIEQEQKMTYVNTIERVGHRRGEASLLGRQLIQKFGPLTTETQERLEAATSAQLETWSLNILDANSLDDVFTD